MKILIPLLIVLLSTFSSAKMMDAIAMIVEGEPVTTSEIQALQSRANLSKQQAIDLLIQDRLQKAAMKNIIIPEDEIDKEISRIAGQNGLSVAKMQKLLEKQGIKWSKYRKTIREALKKRHFFKEKVAPSIPMPSDEELHQFYENHREEFVIPAAIRVIEYSAPSEAQLKDYISTGKKKGIQHKKMTKRTADMNPALMGMLLQTPVGSFTKPMNAGVAFIAYKVLDKSGKRQMPFESAKPVITARWRQQQQERAVKDYFQKMRTEANIKIIRK
jgi:parvulin-like peptidyl-prolyl isomerase